jgi:hypothetical protein
MNSYDDFILELGEVAQFPKNIYAKIRLRIVAEKIILPASLAASILCVFIGIFLFNHKDYRLDFDITADAEEFLFARNDNFYSLFDDR